MKTYAWMPTNGERYSDEFASYEAAIEDARAVCGCDGEEIFVGEVRWPKMSEFYGFENCLRDCPEAAWEVHDAHEWEPEASAEAVAEANAWIDSWAERHGLQPDFFVVENERAVVLDG